MKEKDCYNCKNTEVKSTELPCISCDPNTMSQWESAKPTPDLIALLKRCKPWLEAYKQNLWNQGSEQDYHATEELDDLLSDIAKAEEGR